MIPVVKEIRGRGWGEGEGAGCLGGGECSYVRLTLIDLGGNCCGDLRVFIFILDNLCMLVSDFS